MNKLLEYNSLASVVERLRREGKCIIHAHGTFDRMHVGHLLHLKNAKSLQENAVLIVTITCDAGVKDNKGAGRPICDQTVRAEALCELESVDFVCIIDSTMGIDAIHIVKPDLYVKGEEYAASIGQNRALQEERDVVQHYGGKLVFVGSAVPQFSTSLLTASEGSDETYDFLVDLLRLSSSESILDVLKRMKEKRVLVIGDSIFDWTLYASVGDKAPKTTILPTIHLSTEHFESKSPGGALYIADTISNFCQQAAICSGIGELEIVSGLLFPYNQVVDKINRKIERHLYYLPDRPPNVKLRIKESIFVEHDFRRTIDQICFLDQRAFPDDTQEAILTDLETTIPRYDVVVLADFGHGCISDAIYSLCQRFDVFIASMTQMNESNLGMNALWKVPRADFLCIDDVELYLAFGNQFAEVEALAQVLAETRRFKTIAVTQGKHGCLMTTPNLLQRVPAISATIIDRIGAGDVFLSLATLALASDATPTEAGFIANIGGALACAIHGNTDTVTSKQIEQYVRRLFRS